MDVEGAILTNAKSIIIAHNHPSVDVETSDADKKVTQALVGAGELVDIPVVDHVIISYRGSYYSFRDNALMGGRTFNPYASICNFIICEIILKFSTFFDFHVINRWFIFAN